MKGEGVRGKGKQQAAQGPLKPFSNYLQRGGVSHVSTPVHLGKLCVYRGTGGY